MERQTSSGVVSAAPDQSPLSRVDLQHVSRRIELRTAAHDRASRVRADYPLTDLEVFSSRVHQLATFDLQPLQSIALAQAYFDRYQHGTDQNRDDADQAYRCLQSLLHAEDTEIRLAAEHLNAKLAFECSARHHTLEHIRKAREATHKAFMSAASQLDAQEVQSASLVAMCEESLVDYCLVAYLYCDLVEDRGLLQETIAMAEMGIASVELDSPQRPFLIGLHGLGIVKQHPTDKAQLTQALERLIQAIADPTFSETTHWQVRLWYSAALRAFYKLNGETSHLVKARAQMEQVLENESSMLRRQLFACLEEVFEINYDLSLARWKHDVLHLTSKMLDTNILLQDFLSHPYVATFYLQLSKQSMLAYYRFGSPHFISSALASIARAAVLANSGGLSPYEEQRDVMHCNAHLQLLNYSRYHALDDLREAIAFAEASVASLKSPDIVMRVTTLCYALRLQAARSGSNGNELTECSRWLTLVEPAQPSAAPRVRVSYKMTCAEVEWSKQRMLKSRDLSAVSTLMQEAVSIGDVGLWPGDLPQLQMANICIDSRTPGSLKEADLLLQQHKQALLAQGLNSNGDYVVALARLEQARYELSPSAATARRWLKQAYQVLRTTVSPTQVLSYSVEIAEREDEFNGDWDASARAWKNALSTLVRVCSDALPYRDRLILIREYRYLSAATALSMQKQGAPVSAIVEAIESGRSILWSSLLNKATSFDQLRQVDGQLADKYQILQTQLTAARRVFAERANLASKIEISSALNDTIAQIRTLPGLDDFLLPPVGEKALLGLAASGPIVLPISGPSHGLAIIITSRIWMIKLPSYNSSECLEKSQQLQGLSSSASATMEDILDWLWHAVVGPVLHYIFEPKSRIWWVTIGFANIFPLHAACSKSAVIRGASCAMDLVISSYTPSIRALMSLRERGATSGTSLTVAMPKTPPDIKNKKRYPDLTCAQIEADVVNAYLAPFLEPAKGVTRDDVQAGLSLAVLAHFVCHGVADTQHPLHSRLLLSDHNRTPLTVMQLLKTRMQNLQLAYLSAYETAVNKDIDLRDEGLHLCGAFLMAGCPNVIASLWRIADNAALKIASDFYAALTAGSTLRLDAAASAIHEACNASRMRGEDAIHWAAYVHYGV